VTLVASKTYYEILGVDKNATKAQLRSAYRNLAKQNHPDVTSGSQNKMQELNRAWLILSDLSTRNEYDSILFQDDIEEVAIPQPQPMPQTKLTRRQAWSAGVQTQVEKLVYQAGRSATQTLLLKNHQQVRSDYDDLLPALAKEIANDTEARVRSARAAGTTPLDLGVASTLVGIRFVANEIKRQSPPITKSQILKAELLDRMWDILAYELTHELVVSLGGNPKLAEYLNNQPK